MFAFLLALQAAGMVTDWMGTKNQADIARWGSKVEQAGIESNIATNRLEYEEQSLASMKELRKIMGSQAATLAARGTRGNAGSGLSLSFESVSNFNADERVKRMNMLNNEAQLKAGKTISQLHQIGNNQTLWNSFGQRTISKIPSSPEAMESWGKSFNKSFGLTKA